MTIQRMDHVGVVVVDDLEAAIAFFVELGMDLHGGTAPVEGVWVDRVVGLEDVRVEIAFVRTPDGHGRLEFTKFHYPTATAAEPDAPANTFGLRRIMFAVDDIDDTVVRMRAHEGERIGEVAQYGIVPPVLPPRSRRHHRRTRRGAPLNPNADRSR